MLRSALAINVNTSRDCSDEPKDGLVNLGSLGHIEELARAGAIGCLQEERRSLYRERKHLSLLLLVRPRTLRPVARHDPHGPFIVRVSIPVQIGQLDLRASRSRLEATDAGS